MKNQPAPTRSLAYPDDARATAMLDGLVSVESGAAYQKLMYDIGALLAEKLLAEKKLETSSKICLVSTVEDADFLSKGIYDVLKGRGFNMFFICMWNQREKVFDGGVTVAPIIRTFEQPGFEECDEMIVVKSIISGSCVVKTNITALFGKVQPEKIHVVAPVMHADSEKNLLKEFPATYSRKFDFQFFAKDSFRDNSTGEIKPGIGGNVYQRLGFADQRDKNRYYPKVVKEFLAAM
ncbi:MULTISPECIES: hypothetical protein [Pseudomonas]|uniref:hypothetical protein n=1 Tax=Pseudomonas TaxID=286 RepID=UPI000A432F7B|nr:MULTISPECIES: hypothetical protein [Pseudomonas]MBF8787643.1 hypothetical protein [Pseudomonas asiatica]QUN67572.1 hypothetical protein KDB76_27730 [Pseudomonas sp. JS425]